MNIDSIKNGIVIDHIKAGEGMKLYHFLDLDRLDCSVALIKNAVSRQMGRKDIIKIDALPDIDLNILGYIAPGVTINVIRDGLLTDKYHPELPQKIINVIRCKNPRCITTTEQALPHIFKLTDREKRIYRCIYCETRADQ